MLLEIAAAVAAFVTVVLPALADAPSLARNIFFEPFKQDSATIIFGGDMMFDRTVRNAMEREGEDYVFSCIASTLQEADLVVANLEGPITEHASMSVGSVIGSLENMTFTFPTSTAGLLARHNIRLVSIGNNHIMNFGNDGLAQTKVWLQDVGVRYFGDPAAPSLVASLDIGDIPFSFVSWSDWTGSSKEEVLRQIGLEASSGRTVVVYAHWGEEYEPPTERVQILAREFVDAGAEIVIGSHPHIVQEEETYRGKHIYYSLGNFVFDQYWNEDVRTGLLVRITFSEEGVSNIEEIFVRMKGGQTCVRV